MKEEALCPSCDDEHKSHDHLGLSCSVFYADRKQTRPQMRKQTLLWIILRRLRCLTCTSNSTKQISGKPFKRKVNLAVTCNPREIATNLSLNGKTFAQLKD